MAKNTAWYINKISATEMERSILYNMYILPLDASLKDLRTQLRNTCKHPDEMILVNETYEEDEYGKHHSSWDLMEFECTICKKAKKVNAKWYKNKSDARFSELLELPQEELNRLK